VLYAPPLLPEFEPSRWQDSIFKSNPLTLTRQRGKKRPMGSPASSRPLTLGDRETVAQTQGTESPSKAGPNNSGPAFCLDSQSLSSSVSQAERGASEPETDSVDIDFTPEIERSEPNSLLLETRGLTSHPVQRVMWEREIVFQQSILAKLRSIGKVALAGKMSECHTIETFKRCTGCRKVTKFFNRCEQFFCPVCAPRLSRERQQSIEWWTKQVQQPKHLVLTVRNTSDLTQEYVKFLKRQLASLRRLKVFSSVKGGFYSMEVTNEGRGWHVHFHLLIETPWLNMRDISEQWGRLVGQDFAIVKIKDCRGEAYLKEVTKYAVKGSELASWSPEDIATFIKTFKGVRFFGVFGSLYGKRTEWRAWLDAIQDIRPVCSCGCDSWRILSPSELLWEEETGAGRSGVPPPSVTQVSLSQIDMPFGGQTSMRWPD